MKKRFVCALLALVLLVGLVPVTASAAENKISEAVKQAGELREQGLNVAMIPMNPANDKAYYTNYAEQNRFAKVEWMDGE